MTTTTKPPVQFKASTGEIFVYDFIGRDRQTGEVGVLPEHIADALRQLKSTRQIVVRINSIGGDVFDGVAIYGLLKDSGKDIVVIVDGLAASAASLIAMAGKTIRMNEASVMMIHKVSVSLRGADDAELERQRNLIQKLEGQYVQIYSRRTGQTTAKIQDLMAAETWMTGDEAVALGFADEVVTGVKAAACAIDAARFGYKNAPPTLTSANTRTVNDDLQDRINSVRGNGRQQFDQRCEEIQADADKSPVCDDVSKMRVRFNIVQAAGHFAERKYADAETYLAEARALASGARDVGASREDEDRKRAARIERTRKDYRFIDERDERFATCLHELGHAVGSAIYDSPDSVVDIQVNRDGSGVCFHQPIASQDAQERFALTGIAGVRIFGHEASGFAKDLQAICGKNYAEHPSGIYELSEPLGIADLRREVERDLTEHKSFIHRLASLLYHDGEMSGSEFRSEWTKYKA